MTDEQHEYIDLQSAHVTQYSNDGVKGDWHVRQNITNDDLFVFPPSISDDLMFQILRFARDYELKAFNSGIKFQKNKQNEFLMAQISELKGINSKLASENERLADILEQYIGED